LKAFSPTTYLNLKLRRSLKRFIKKYVKMSAELYHGRYENLGLMKNNEKGPIYRVKDSKDVFNPK
jgi:hypothetical protein